MVGINACMTAPDVVTWIESGVVVGGAHPTRRAVERPLGSGPPRLRLDVVAVGTHVQGGRSFGSAHGSPGVAQADPHRRVPGTTTEREEGGGKVDRRVGSDQTLR